MDLLQTVSYLSIGIAIVSMIIIIIDIVAGHKQHMKIMNIVWPITALYSGVLGLIAYYTIGRKGTMNNMMMNDNSQQHSHQKGQEHNGMQHMNMKQKPMWQSVLLGALHCGSGCTLGDLIVESLLSVVTITLISNPLFNEWIIDFMAAFLIGILFQYYAIKPMKKLSSGEALKAAVKADTLSLTFWQVGMYGWMAIAIFLIFHHSLEASMPLFWFMMQIAMLVGFLCAYPVNWWLIKKGIKEKM